MRQQQAQLFLYFIALGAAGSLVYDGLRGLRRELKHPDWLVILEDGLFWTAALIGCYGLFFFENRGALRGYGFLGMVCGAVLYFLLGSPWMFPLWRGLWRILLFPVKKLLTKGRKWGKMRKKKKMAAAAAGAEHTAEAGGKGQEASLWRKKKKKKPLSIQK